MIPPAAAAPCRFAGQNARFNRFSVDGVPVTDNFGLNPDGLPSRRSPVPFDAIGQFQTKVAPYDVREGNFQGGAINIVLKSGTNEFHGTGFYAYSADELIGKKTKAGPGHPDRQASPCRTSRSRTYGAELAARSSRTSCSSWSPASACAPARRSRKARPTTTPAPSSPT